MQTSARLHTKNIMFISFTLFSYSTSYIIPIQSQKQHGHASSAPFTSCTPSKKRWSCSAARAFLAAKKHYFSKILPQPTPTDVLAVASVASKQCLEIVLFYHWRLCYHQKPSNFFYAKALENFRQRHCSSSTY